jgi:methionyl-tRNA formyltransferase
VLNKYLKDDLKLVAQEHEKATFTKPLTRQDGFIDLSSSLEIKKLKLKIFAYYPWPGVWFKTKLNDTEKIIKLLPGDRLQVEGKKPMTYKDFLNGYPEAKEILEKIN